MVQLNERTKDVAITEDVTFETMLLKNRTLEGLKYVGFYRPSPIQLHGIPLGKCGFDLLLEAKSGTGKTAVFTIVALEKLDLDKSLQAIILAPTREIAAQVCDVIKQIGSEYEGLIVEVVMGGLSLQEDIEKLKKRTHIIVASPGRLKHLIEYKHVDVSSVKLLVLDECDKLMEKSFLSDVNYIFACLPVQKQIIMSSATYPDHCITFINSYVKNVQHICPNSNSILVGIEQFVTTVPYNSNIVKQTNYKVEELLKILSNHQFKQCLIFCNYIARVVDIQKKLKKDKWPAALLHGQQDQRNRLSTLTALQEYKCRILISTDLAARGIDASNVDLVINFEPPYEWQTYLHRIGRAGRFGSYGTAITILSEGVEVNKFQITIGMLKAPKIVKRLWTDDEFDIDDIKSDITDQPIDTTTKLYKEKENMNGNCSNLWELLIKEENNLKPLQTFEELVNSLKEANVTKIDTFPDLIQSFENIQEDIHDNINIPYKCIILKEYLQCNNKGNLHLAPEIIFNGNGCTSVNNSTSASNISENNIEQENHYTTDKKNYINSNEDETALINANHSERALLEVGLPICFETKKHKKYKSKLIDRNNKINNYSIDDCVRDNKDKDSGHQKFIKGKACTSNEKQSTSEDNKTILSQKVNITNRRTKQDLRTSHNISEGQVLYNTDGHFDYISWYNQLKTQMQYLEQSFYIEEMSNL